MDEFFAATWMDANDMGCWRISSPDMDRPACYQNRFGGGSIIFADTVKEGRFEILCWVPLIWHIFSLSPGHHSKLVSSCLERSRKQKAGHMMANLSPVFFCESS